MTNKSTQTVATNHRRIHMARTTAESLLHIALGKHTSSCLLSLTRQSCINIYTSSPHTPYLHIRSIFFFLLYVAGWPWSVRRLLDVRLHLLHWPHIRRAICAGNQGQGPGRDGPEIRSHHHADDKSMRHGHTRRVFSVVVVEWRASTRGVCAWTVCALDAPTIAIYIYNIGSRPRGCV